MARLPRYLLPGQPQHLIQRGNNRSRVFFASEDYRFYLRCLRQASDRHQVAIHAYVLMTNHVHIVASPRTAYGLSKMMHVLGLRYAQHVNFLYQRSGTIWEGRFKAAPIDSEPYLMTCFKYVELNPVRAGIVDSPGHYCWSSYGHNACGRQDVLLTHHGVYEALADRPEDRCRRYRALFDVEIDEPVLNVIREATNQGWAIGSDRFRTNIERASSRRSSPLPRGGRREGAGRPRIK